MYNIQDPATKSHLLDIESRIQSFSLLHETLYRAEVFNEADVAKYLTLVAETLHDSADADDVELQLEMATTMLPVKSTLYLGLVLVELLTNAFKYGKNKSGPSLVRISLEVVGANRAVLTVQDNGPGIPDNLRSGREESLGIKLILMMAAELRGSIRYEVDGGTRAVFEFSTDTA